jgi:thiosulfate reductase cytochrome b subunit
MKETLDKITNLTSDPEVQSEMWIILASNSDVTPEEALENAMMMLRESENTFWVISTLISQKLKPHTIEMLDSLEPIEKSVISMIMLGFKRPYILEYNNLSYIRYNQVMTAFLSSGPWRRFLEEEANFRRTSGS